MPKKGGYKIVSLHKIDLLGSSLVLAGLYLALINSYDKPIMLSDINIDGEIKKDALVQAEKGQNKVTIKNLYGYDLEISNEDAITVAPSPDRIELPVPEVADAGKVVKVDAEGKYALGEDVGGMVNPMTSANDLIVGGVNGAPARLQVGAEGKILKVGSSGIEWGDAPAGGTKLYKHNISIFDGGPNQIITNSDDSINSIDKLLNLAKYGSYSLGQTSVVIVGLIFAGYQGTTKKIIDGSDDETNGSFYYIGTDGSYSHIDFPLATVVTDIVTEI